MIPEWSLCYISTNQFRSLSLVLWSHCPGFDSHSFYFFRLMLQLWATLMQRNLPLYWEILTCPKKQKMATKVSNNGFSICVDWIQYSYTSGVSNTQTDFGPHEIQTNLVVSKSKKMNLYFYNQKLNKMLYFPDYHGPYVSGPCFADTS